MFKKVVFALFLSIFLFGPVFANEEFWNTDTVQFTVKENIRFNVIPELRFNNNGLYYFLTYIGPTFSLSKNLDVNIYYAPKNSKNSTGWQASNNGFLDLIYKNGGLNNRSRFELDFTNYIYKFREQFCLQANGWFVQDEVFYNFTRGMFDENRAAAGYNLKMTKSANLTFGYMLRSQKTSSIVSTNVLMINAALKI